MYVQLKANMHERGHFRTFCFQIKKIKAVKYCVCAQNNKENQVTAHTPQLFPVFSFHLLSADPCCSTLQQ